MYLGTVIEQALISDVVQFLTLHCFHDVLLSVMLAVSCCLEVCQHNNLQNDCVSIIRVDLESATIPPHRSTLGLELICYATLLEDIFTVPCIQSCFECLIADSHTIEAKQISQTYQPIDSDQVLGRGR